MAKYSTGLREEELKLKVAADWFAAYDTTRIIGNIDFCVAIPATELGLYEAENALWAEAKAGVRKDIHESFVQLILTIGRARTFDRERPPLFLGAFDAEKIAFLPYDAVMDVFAQNDFNWNVAPSDHDSKEFAQLHELAERTIAAKSLLFNFASDEAELKKFVRQNFKSGRKDVSRIQINKNNFTHIYRKWREAVLPHIDAPWDVLKRKYSLYDRDFYLAELNVDDNGTADISDDRVAAEFYITFNANGQNKYRIQRKNADELSVELTFGFKTEAGLVAYAAFWSRYKRPPRKDYWNYIVKRLDLLVPQDVRERKGAFFTPQKWVELSQEYLARELGENWQDEYDVWDCCAGTGNMEAGLTNKYRVWASTLDQQDVDVMKERIRNGANLLESHVFQFDFLNDSFDDLPEGLRQIVSDPERRKKLVIYINPPYAEVSTIGGGKKGVNQTKTHDKYADMLGTAGRELYTQFLIRMAKELDGCVIGHFSTLKILQGGAFEKFRSAFRPLLKSLFMVPANTFDNVKGEFPIGFFIWETSTQADFTEITADVFDRDGLPLEPKHVRLNVDCPLITDWVAKNIPLKPSGETIGFLAKTNSNDFQNNNIICVLNKKEQLPNPRGRWIDADSLQICAVYYAIRKCLDATWLNDRDQFLCPNDGWKGDGEFKGNCLVYTLFHGQNRISCEHGVNHWIPFTEEEVGAQDCFASHFMSDFLKGKVGAERGDLFSCGDRNVAAPADCGAVGTPRPTALDYYRSHELGKTWYDVADCAALSGMDSVHIDVPDAKADRNAVKAAFRAMKFVRNEADGRLVAFPVAAAKKLMRHPHLNVFGLAKDFGRLFAKSRRLWSELTAEISNHREHRNVTCYHQYVAKADWDGESVYVRFTVREGYGRVGQNELHGTMVSRIAVYKAKGAELSDPSHVQGEGSTPFVDNKIALFLSAVNGGPENDKNGQTGFVISTEAHAVLDAGRELWRYYHKQPKANPNASYYDIRKFFQGVKVDAKGKEKMNATSADAGYNERLAALKAAMKRLAAAIEPKVYEYGFLRK